MEEIRSFIAIELPDKVRQGLSRLVAQLKYRQPNGIKWVDPTGIHLTLKFLGNITSGRISEITGAMTEASREIPPFSLEIKDLGVFPNLNRVQVAWIGVGGETDKLVRLQQRLESNLKILGFPPEKRGFAPHLTLARVRREASSQDRQELGRLIAVTKPDPIGRFTVGTASLMQSQLSREGAVYTQIGAALLKK
ncbi:MAG: RNA 2',3'-cyclic phosphodiesterase [Dehalococcoidales bacterium]|jgi:2'-5' RNA ligase|nr:RNA 2',3'-cyclic phosphodiesterase [Dehalococcoidales bacterium]MDP6221724.1 RNA 2',3'-cyclic phosphodiesterase [Dehalococcoidales bacterium]MDP7409974.1 RNA 2',3'-cyclic phosphodiesterase [Dehalococcoidales bacterium]MDP7675391.1 RNA 2',3'-cyclic phosphodiesterase [Dehalococcoidales bacterium]